MYLMTGMADVAGMEDMTETEDVTEMEDVTETEDVKNDVRTACRHSLLNRGGTCINLLRSALMTSRPSGLLTGCIGQHL